VSRDGEAKLEASFREFANAMLLPESSIHALLKPKRLWRANAQAHLRAIT
jgi:hypothetical protein